jgi:hypothetical protein
LKKGILKFLAERWWKDPKMSDNNLSLKFVSDNFMYSTFRVIRRVCGKNSPKCSTANFYLTLTMVKNSRKT